MSQLISLGAMNKHTGEYVYPKIANKKDEYVCSDCNKDLILVKGDIRVHHFRHKVDNINPCHHYSNPTETQIHKDAKMLMKTLLERKIPISFIRNCYGCKNNEVYEIPEISETSNIHLEYRFQYNGLKIADVAYLDDNGLTCIFEICNTHKTCSENRPEPWFEINAKTLIKLANINNLLSLQIPCIRYEECKNCYILNNECSMGGTCSKNLECSYCEYCCREEGICGYDDYYIQENGIKKILKYKNTDCCICERCDGTGWDHGGNCLICNL